MKRRLLQRVARETHDRKAVANFSTVRGGPVYFDDSSACFAIDHVSLEPFPVAEVGNENFLIGNRPTSSARSPEIARLPS